MRDYFAIEAPRKWTLRWVAEGWQPTTDLERLAALRKRDKTENRTPTYFIAALHTIEDLAVAGIITVAAVMLADPNLYLGFPLVEWVVEAALLASIAWAAYLGLRNAIGVEVEAHRIVEAAIPGHWCYQVENERGRQKKIAARMGKG